MKKNLIKISQNFVSILLIIVYMVFTFLLSFAFFIIIFFIKDLRKGFIRRFFPSKYKIQKDIIVHASSAGEAILAYNLFSDNVNYTYFNDGAYQIFKAKNAQQNPLPFDSIFAILIFILKNKYKKIIFIEQEIWPAFLFLNKIFGKKLYLINCNMYQKSFETQKKLKFIFSFLFSLFDEIVAKSDEDKGKIIKINKELDVKSFSNFKIFSSYKSFNLLDKSSLYFDDIIKHKKKIILFSSFHPAEYDIFIEVLNKSRNHNDIKYVIAPRYIDKLKPLEEKLSSHKISYRLFNEFTRFDLDKANNKENNNKNSKENSKDNISFIIDKFYESDFSVLIIDCFGILPYLYKFSFLSIIGGSFNNKGGQNFIEPLLQICPVIIGPSYENFSDLINYFNGPYLSIIDKNDCNYATDRIIEILNIYINNIDVDIYEKLKTKILQLLKIAEKQRDYIEFILKRDKDEKN